jgi:hypothetical protein
VHPSGKWRSYAFRFEKTERVRHVQLAKVNAEDLPMRVVCHPVINDGVERFVIEQPGLLIRWDGLDERSHLAVIPGRLRDWRSHFKSAI